MGEGDLNTYEGEKTDTSKPNSLRDEWWEKDGKRILREINGSGKESLSDDQPVLDQAAKELDQNLEKDERGPLEMPLEDDFTNIDSVESSVVSDSPKDKKEEDRGENAEPDQHDERLKLSEELDTEFTNFKPIELVVRIEKEKEANNKKFDDELRANDEEYERRKTEIIKKRDQKNSLYDTAIQAAKELEDKLEQLNNQ